MMGGGNNGVISLSAGRHLQHCQHDGHDSLQIVNADGRLAFTIELTDAGPVFRFEGDSISIQSAGKLSLEADSLAFHADRRLSLSCHGDIVIESDGEIDSSAQTQIISSRLGNVNIQANDDVKLNGERVLVNCPFGKVLPVQSSVSELNRDKH